MSAPTGLVPLASVLNSAATALKMASILRSLWDPDRKIRDEPDSELDVCFGRDWIQIQANNREWLEFKPSLECIGGTGRTEHDWQFEVPVHNPSEVWPTAEMIAHSPCDRVILEWLRWLGTNAVAMFRDWFLSEAAAGDLELWGAPDSETAGLVRIPPHALVIGSQRASIDFQRSTLTTPTTKKVFYALHWMWSEPDEPKPRLAKKEARSTAATMLEYMLATPHRVIMNPELRSWLKSVGGKISNFPREKKLALGKLSKVAPELADRYRKFFPKGKKP